MHQNANTLPELVSGYRFRSLEGLPLLKDRIRDRARSLGLLGTVLIAPEGTNFSLAGPPAALSEWLSWAAEGLGLDRPVLHRQPVGSVPFLRLKVRIRREIITFEPAVRPDHSHAPAQVRPEDWNRLMDREGVQLVDTRNDYEVALGTFQGAMDPDTENFTEFKGWAETHLDPCRPVAMFCTGGVRCEKAGAWLKSRGFERVCQLQGGILNYLQAVPEAQSRWHGECFVFDDRVSVDGRLRSSGRQVCAGCRRPAEGLDRWGMPPVDDEGCCWACGAEFEPQRLEGLRERVRQVRLAAARGDRHLGPQESRIFRKGQPQ